jgi:hypothetical protein
LSGFEGRQGEGKASSPFFEKKGPKKLLSLGFRGPEPTGQLSAEDRKYHDADTQA